MNANPRILAILLPLAMATTAACSRPDELCSLVCECEHCNEWQEAETCGQISLSLDIAESYDCESAWDSWAECFENNGQCYDGQAAYSTSDLGSCNVHVNVQSACATDAECRQQQSNYFCSGGTCVYKACDNSPAGNPQACTTHSECPAGEDKCEAVAQVLLDCEQGAAGISVTPVYGSVPH